MALNERTRPRTNLANNPRFRRCAPGSATARRNLAPDTQGSQVGTGWGFVARWGGSGGGQTVNTVVTGVTDGPLPTITRYGRKTWSVIGNGASDISWSFNRGARVLLVPGRPYTVSFFWRSSFLPSQATLSRLRVLTYAAPSGGTAVEPVALPHTSFPAKGEWQRLSITFTVTPENPYVDVFHYLQLNNLPVLGDTVDATGLLVEERPHLLPFFDGSTVDNSGFAYAWEGSALASTSVAKAQIAEVIRNYARNPSLEVNSVGWSAGSPAGTVGTRNPVGPNGPTWDVTVGTDLTNHFRVSFGDSDAITGIGNGSLITIALDVFAPAATTGVYIQVSTPTAGGTTYPGTPSKTLVPGWQRVVFTFTVPSNTTGALSANAFTFMVPPGSLIANSSWRFSRATIVVFSAAYDGAYFDGNITFDGDFTPAWTGTPGSSVSGLYYVVPFHASWANGARSAVSLRLPEAGVRVIGVGSDAATEAWAVVAGAAPSGLTGFNITFEPGKTYTLLVKSYLEKPTLGTHPNARRSQFMAGIQTGVWQASASATQQAPNVAGYTEHRLVVTMPPNVAWAVIRLGGSSGLGTGDVWWGDLMIVEGDYKGPYLDGDSKNCIWRGTPHNSQSSGYALAS